MEKESKNKLLIDCTYVWNCYTGLAIYSITLLKGLKTYAPEIQVSVLFHKENPYKEFEQLVGFQLDIILIPHTSEVKPVFLSHKLDRMRGKVFFEDILIDKGIDCVLTPFLTWQPFVFPEKYRQCAVIHDLQAIKLARQKSYMEALKVSMWLKFFIRKIPRLIAISSEIQRQVKSFANKKAMVIYNSLPLHDELSPVPVERIAGKKYILNVNRFYRYKNAETLIRAFDMIKEDIPHLLYLKGSDTSVEDYPFLKDLVRSLKLEDRVILDTEDHTKEEMAYLYKHADLFVSPSRWEGFGYTPIEAALFKVPVIVSDINTFRDVTRGKFPMFNPDSAEELAQKILDILHSPPSPEELSSTAEFFKQTYSLEKQIRMIVDTLYKS